MAIKFKIDSVSFRKLRKKITNLSKEPFKKEDAKPLGKEVVRQMKKNISSGISTVRGSGIRTRMPRYKNPNRYPGKRKSKRPVNLKLTGDFLNALKSKIVKNGIEVGYFKSSESIKEKGHSIGANKQPKRPTIPDTGKKQRFNATLTKIIIKRMNKSLKKQLEKD